MCFAVPGGSKLDRRPMAHADLLSLQGTGMKYACFQLQKRGSFQILNVP